jgi:hypothetical protein
MKFEEEKPYKSILSDFVNNQNLGRFDKRKCALM